MKLDTRLGWDSECICGDVGTLAGSTGPGRRKIRDVDQVKEASRAGLRDTAFAGDCGRIGDVLSVLLCDFASAVPSSFGDTVCVLPLGCHRFGVVIRDCSGLFGSEAMGAWSH